MMDDDLARALADLAAAYHRTQAALTAAAESGQAAAFDALIRLDDALRETEPVLPQLAELLKVADPGDDVTAELERRREAISELRGRAAYQRLRIDRLRRSVEDLAGVEEEYARLREERDRLERVQELSERLPELREIVERLAEAIEPLRSGNADAERSLKEALDAWPVLTDELRALIEPRVADAYAKAEAQLKDLTDKIAKERAAEAHLTDRKMKYDAAAERHARALRESEHFVQGLLLYAEADRALVDALLEAGTDTAGAEPGIEQVDAALRRCERGLAAIDQALRAQLEARTAVPEILRLGDGPGD
ncbi:hypothetical protein ACIBEJ_09055 [Nonomuraea sp. NPDC050790]|uniref:hypothetical protein n=1 Tax=Nonomuraea sp. NPDC050790 TaxID=3364371 RepID=UPI00379B34A0